MKYAIAIIGGLFVAFAVYFVVWFFARNIVDGLGAGIETGGHLLVVFIALVAGFSSFRASLGRRQGPPRHPMSSDTRLNSIDPSLIRQVRGMARPHDQFVALVDVLIDRNSKLEHGGSAGTDAQRAMATIAALDVQVQNGGLVQFFWNCPQLVEHVAPALRQVGLASLAGHFDQAVSQLAGDIASFIKRREAGGVDEFMDAAAEQDFEWFEDLYFGEFDRSADRWSGLVEQMYRCSVSFMLGNLSQFVVQPPV